MGRVVRNEFALSNESTKETEPYENESSTQDTEIKGEIEPVAQQDKNSCLLLQLYSLAAEKYEICIERGVLKFMENGRPPEAVASDRKRSQPAQQRAKQMGGRAANEPT